MGQPNAKRLQYSAKHALTSTVNDDRHTLSNTHFLKVGDEIEFWDENASGCLETLIGVRTVTAVCPDEAVVVDSAIDMSSLSGSACIRNRSLDDVQAAMDRLYDCGFEAEDFLLQFAAPITASATDSPIVGQSEQTVSDATCWAAGDSWQIIDDNGLQGSGTVIGIDASTNEVILDTSIDAFGTLSNPKLLNTSVDLKTQLVRLKSLIDQVGSPICEELLDGDCDNTAFYASQTFVQNSSQLYLDGVRKRKGACGTLASLVNDTVNAEITFTSLVLGTDGNDIDIEFVDPAAASQALAVTVSGSYDGADRKISVSLATDAGLVITSTAQEVADAINADADAKRLVRAIYGGDGTGVQSALAATPLAGGLNDGDGDYCELQVLDNNALGGYGILSFHIRPNEGNRMSCPPQESEELDLCYSKAV